MCIRDRSIHWVIYLLLIKVRAVIRRNTTTAQMVTLRLLSALLPLFSLTFTENTPTKNKKRPVKITRRVIALKLLPENHIIFLQFCQLLWNSGHGNQFSKQKYKIITFLLQTVQQEKFVEW